MFLQELTDTFMEERMREAAGLRRLEEAEHLQRQDVSPRHGLSRQHIRRLPFLAFVARMFRMASVWCLLPDARLLDG